MIALAYQGYFPAPPSDILRQLIRSSGPLEWRLRRVVSDLGLDLLAINARRRHRELLGAVPALACHLEEGVLAGGVDWERIAADTDAWAVQAGFEA